MLQRRGEIGAADASDIELGVPQGAKQGAFGGVEEIDALDGLALNFPRPGDAVQQPDAGRGAWTAAIIPDIPSRARRRRLGRLLSSSHHSATSGQSRRRPPFAPVHIAKGMWKYPHFGAMNGEGKVFDPYAFY